MLTVLATGLNYGSQFRLRWDELPPADPKAEAGGVVVGTPGSEFKCGGVLNPTYATQSFSLPVNSDGE